MTRADMLKALSCVPFTLIDPLSEWEDVGFTERPIWVNSKGYGYIMCDEPCSSCEVDGVPLKKWETIHQKLADGSLQLEDLEGTSLPGLLEEITYGCFDEDEDDLCEVLSGLVELPSEQLERIYGVQSDDGWQFFSTQEEFTRAYERDWADVTWEELDEEILLEWLDRLSTEPDPRLERWASNHCPKIVDEDSTEDVIIETEKYDGYWTAHNTKEFVFCASTTVYEGKKKRYASLMAINNSRTNVPQTVFKVTSTRHDVIASYIIAGCTEDGCHISSDDELGKWCVVKNKLYQRLLNTVVTIAGKDPYARSLELFLSIKQALDSNLLDSLIKEYENKSN